jgi:zinc protease
LLSLSAMSAQQIDRTKPPETPPLAPFKLPAVVEKKLPNGLGVLMVEDKRFPLVTMRLVFRSGSRFDPPSQVGLSETLAQLLTEGTATRNSRQIAEQLAAIGATLSASSGADQTTVAGSVLSDQLPTLLELAADVARNATFPEEELTLRKQNRVQELQLERSQSEVLAQEKAYDLVFGKHPYSETLPTPASIASITRKDLLGLRDRLLVPNNAVLILVGAIPPLDKLLAVVGKQFGSWANKPVPAAPGGEIPKPSRSITLIDRPGSAQVDILVAHQTPPRTSPDYFPLVVGNSVLGGGASSRMFMNIREKQGFAYHAGSHNTAYKDAGIWSANTQVRDEVLEPAIKAVFAELERMSKEPVAATELSATKNYMNGTFVMQLATLDGVAGQLAFTMANDLPADYLEKYVPRIRSVEPDQIQRIAARYFSPADATVVMVGDASKIGKIVEKFGTVKVEKAQ